MSSAPGTIIMITRPYSRSSIGPRNCAPFARNSSTVASISSHMIAIEYCRRVIISFAFPDAVRRVHAHLARSRFEDQPVVIPIFGHILPAEHVPQKRPRRLLVVGINQGVN